jgi:hypothetical protein
MAVLFRAVVMLLVLVGIPSAWIYYGPLPAGAQRFVDRLVEIGKGALAGETPTSQEDEWITAPRYAFAAEPIQHVPRVTAASFTSAPASPQTDGSLQEQLDPHLSVLRKLGATQYALEDWGQDGRLVRFRCAVALGADKDFTRQFEAVADDSLAAVRQVVGEVSSWQNARGGGQIWR